MCVKQSTIAVMIIICNLTEIGFCAPATEGSVDSKKVICNMDFESGSENPRDYWSGISPRGSKVTIINNDDLIGSSRCTKLETAEKPVSLWGFSVDITPGAEYVISADVRSPEKGAFQLYYDSLMGRKHIRRKHFYKKEDFIPTTDTWRRYEFKFALLPADKWKNRSLKMRLTATSSNSTYYIDNLKIVQVPKQKKSNSPSRIEKYDLEGGDNLLTNGGFESGFDGWGSTAWSNPKVVRRNGGAFVPASVNLSTDAHNGQYSALLDNKVGLRSEIVYVSAQETDYTIDLYAKADRETKIRVGPMSESWRHSFKKFSIGRQWTHIHYEGHISPQKKSLNHNLVVAILGAPGVPSTKVWIDDVKLSLQKKESFSRPPVKIIFPPASDWNIFLDRNNINIPYRIVNNTGNPMTVNMRFEVFSYDGEVILDKSSNIVIKNVYTKTPKINIPSGKTGLFEASISIFDQSKKLLTRRWTRFALMKPVPPEENPTNLFAVNFGSCQFGEEEAKMFSLAGMRYIRDGHSGYIATKPNKSGKTSPEFIELVRKYNFRVSTLMDTGLPFKKKAGLSPIEANLDFMANYPEDFIEIMRKHVRAKAVQLKGKVDMYEILNEPNIWFDKNGVGCSPKTYFTILKTIVPIIREVDPEVKIISFSTASLYPQAIGFMKSVLELGGKPYIGDFIAFHAYFSSTVYRSQILELRKMLADYSCEDIPLYQTEFGRYKGQLKDILPWANAPQEIMESKVDFYHKTLSSQKISLWERETAEYSTKMDVIAMANNIQANARHGGFEHGMFGNLVIDASMSPLASLCSINHMARLMGNVEQPAQELAVMDAVGYVFKKKGKHAGRAIAVLWVNESPGNKGRIYLNAPEGSVKLFNIMGTEKEVSLRGKEMIVPLSPEPCFIVSDTITAEKLANYIETADTENLGKPFSVKINYNKADKIEVDIKSKQAKEMTVSCEVELSGKPKKIASFSNIKIPGRGKKRISFTAPRLPSLTRNELKVKVTNNDNVRELGFRDYTPIHCQSLKRAIKVDGDLSDWSGLSSFNLGGRHLSKVFGKINWRGDNDLSAKVWTAWTKEALYLAFEINDDVHFDERKFLYKSDSLQLYIDIGNDKGTDKENDYVYGTRLINGKPYIQRYQTADFQISGLTVYSPINSKLAVKRTGGKTCYEIMIPITDLSPLSLEPDKVIGFALLINDNDGEGRKQGLTTCPAKSEPYKNEKNWSDLILLR